MKNHTVKIFKNVFEKDLALLKNENCDKCDALIKHPVMPWIVGDNYLQSNEKILFVGKPHRGTPGEILPSGILDPTKPRPGKLKSDLDWLMDCSWAYWSYTKGILVSLYGDEDPWNYCSFTNIIKCTNVQGKGNPTTDTTTYNMAECCIENLGVIFREIEILEPLNIVFYTSSLYPDFLINLPFASSITEATDQNHKVMCGKKHLGWWSRRAKTSWSDNVKILVTGHPERMKKDHYTSLITDWIHK